jgi:hypothetical protein
MDEKQSLELRSQIISFVQKVKANYEDSYCWITENVAFNMREVIRECRKNYYGIFTQPKDSAGRKKVWIPLTESIVDAVVKNIDKDQKELFIFSKDGTKTKITAVVREIVDDILDEMGFNEALDDLTINESINGTEVWKIIEGKKESVDLLNIYIDPTANSLQEADFLERCVINIDEAKKMKGWMETEDLKGGTSVNRYDGEGVNPAQNSATDLIDAWEFWGKMPKSFITGKEKDEKEIVNGHIIVTGIGSSSAKLQVVETYKDFKPYEECWYSKVPNRWYGRGIAEKLIMLQLYINTVVNIRINRHNVSQLGIFKVKNNSGVSSEMLKRLISNGVIKVNQMDDIEQMPINDVGPGSYNDETNIYTWSQRVSSAFEAATGETQPATMTATVGAIQSKSAGSQFTLVKERIDQFLNRVFKRHLIKYVQKEINNKEIFSVLLKPEEIRKFDEEVADVILAERGQVYEQEEYDKEKEKIIKELEKKGNIRYVKNGGVELEDFDIEFAFNDGNYDKGAMVTDIMNSIKLAPEYRESLMPKVLDILGLNVSLPKAQPQMEMAGQLQPQQTEMQKMSNSMTL